MNGAEILRTVESLTRVKETEYVPGHSINPEVLAMNEILPTLSPRWADFIKRRMAFDVVHLSEPRIRRTELENWRAIRAEIQDYLPQVPQNIGSLPNGWRMVFRDVMLLYGDPHAPK